MENKTLLNYYKLVKSEFEKTVKDFEKNKKIIDNVVLYEIKSPLKLKSGFASYVVRLFDDKIIAIYQKNGKNFSFSLRKGKNLNVDLDNFGKEVTRGIENADGGGHPNAAGMNVPMKHLKSLIENMRLKTGFSSAKR
jgi:single-stranded DNA-specific DHH superfamily exonuclease